MSNNENGCEQIDKSSSEYRCNILLIRIEAKSRIDFRIMSYWGIDRESMSSKHAATLSSNSHLPFVKISSFITMTPTFLFNFEFNFWKIALN